MAMRTGENEQGLKKIIDMTRMISIIVLLIHCYDNCYQAFKEWELTTLLTDKLLNNITGAGLLNGFTKTKLIALGFLLISLMGAKGKMSENINYKTVIAYLSVGLAFYFGSYYFLLLQELDIPVMAIMYMSFTGLGFLLTLTGGSLFARIIKKKLSGEVFNKSGESFPQEERLLKDEFSLNLQARYYYKGKWKSSFINFLNARRSILIMGSAGSGKSYFVVENLIRQIMAKGHVAFIFDHKFPELTTLTYNHYLKNKCKFPRNIEFKCVNFSNPKYSHRCNPIHPSTLPTLTSAIESSKSLLLSMNRSWAGKQGEFFVESAINLLAAVIGFLRKYEGGMYCTIPHAIELIHTPYDKLFTVLQTETEISTLINPFIQAFIDGEMETLNSQMASVKIPLGRISSPEFYYVLSGNDFDLAINNPDRPKIFCLGNNPLYKEALAPIMSLYIDRLNKMINQRGKLPCWQVLDEFASARATSVMETITTGRSNNITSIVAVQDYSQLKMIYSREEAETIFNITGNIISGQVSGETARLLSERFSKTFQDRQSISINSGDTSISKSKQLEQSVPASTISSLSSGEFVGIVADNPNQKIELKAFHSTVVNDHKDIQNEKEHYLFPPRVSDVKTNEIDGIHRIIKDEAVGIVEAVIEQVLNDPESKDLIVKKG